MTMLDYNLTEHTQFRVLEFDCARLKDENADLKARLMSVEQMYRQAVGEGERSRQQGQRREARAREAARGERQKAEEIMNCIAHVFEQLKNYEKLGIDFGLSAQSPQGRSAEWGCGRVKELQSALVQMANRHTESALKYEKEIDRLKAELRHSKTAEKELKEEVEYFSEEISKLEGVNSQLLDDLSAMKRETMDYKLKLYEQSKQQESPEEDRGGELLEDNNFAMDLLHYEKELLQRIFTKVLATIQHPVLSEVLTEIYGAYEAVSEAFREKLQIQYDLQDLERQYRQEKTGRVGEQLLIELRKQIEQFRNELHRQKELLSKEEQTLQAQFLALQAAEKEDRRIRSYTVEVEKKLKDIKSYNDTKRQSEDSSQPSRSRIHFKPTTTDQLMHEMVKQDRENLEKIFRETRLNYGRKGGNP